jgi:uncharacterized protein (DUF1684 family)
LRLVFFFAGFLFISCSRNFERVSFDSTQRNSYLNQLATSRLEKDSYFSAPATSPLTAEQRSAFQHLDYYPPNFDLIFQVKLIPDGEGSRTNILATGGELRPAVKAGEFDFEVGGKKEVLHVYRMVGEDSTELFLPFTDETCGKTSYSGGKYIDLKENSSGVYRLDFNYAYNPYCAYNHDYSCPIVPQENHLDVPIMAGEMKFQ